MADRIAENVLEDILSRVDIVELISGYIPLKRAGRNFRALCPFHHEKTPSFMISPDRQIYHCFGCSCGGNAFNFLMQYERMDFPESVEVLAKKAGVTLPKDQIQDSKAVSIITQLYKINELAALFYEAALNSGNNSAVKNYLLKRGIKEETIKLFKLGYAPDKWDALINHLRAKNIDLSLLEKAGLILSRESGGYYDRFRNRVIFPIFDIKSRAMGFGARALPAPSGAEGDNGLAKYVNSPETPIYTKGKNLYGLNFSKDAIRDSDLVVVVEGYLDLIIPYQEGLHNVVASLGTAFTGEQARLLKRYTQNVVMVYDPDDAGQAATLRTLDIFIEEGMHVKVVSLPDGLDPDLFVRKEGIGNFKKIIEGSENLIDYKLRILKARYNINEPQGKAKIASEILPTIKKFKNEILKSEYVKKVAEELKVAEHHILEELKKTKDTNSYSDINYIVQKKTVSINPVEKLLIKLMLEETALIERIRNTLTPADFQDERVSRVVSLMFDLIKQGKNIEPNNLINYLGGDVISEVICESALLPEVSAQNKENIVDDCIQRLKNERLRLKKQHLHEQITTAQAQGDQEQLHRLMQEFHCLIKERPNEGTT